MSRRRRRGVELCLGKQLAMFEYFSVESDPEDFVLEDHVDFSAMVALWQEKRGDRTMPAWRDFKLQDFVGWHSRMALSEILPSRDDLQFQFFGSDMVFQQGDDLTGCVLSQRLPEAHEKAYRPHIEMMLRKPVFAIGYVEAASDQERHKTIAVMHLPLSDDGKTIDRLLHVTCWESTAANVLYG